MANTGESSGARPNSGRYVAHHDWDSDEQVVVSVVEALADYTGIPARDLPPLYDSVDTDALDRVARTLDPGGSDGQPSVTFPALESDYLVTVHADGGVEITDRS